MEYIFLVLFLVSVLFAGIGVIKPDFLQRYIKRTQSRKQNLKLYGLIALVSFIGIGISAPATDTHPVAGALITQEVIDGAELNDSVAANEVPVPADLEVIDPLSVSEDSLYTVTRVVDGDTIEVLIDGEKKVVRYIGINTPETVHPSKPVECFGLEASNKNKELVAGKSVRLVKDVSETDSYGRLLRYVYVDDVFVNLQLVQGGYANASSYPPDVAFNDDFRSAEQEARMGKRGLWGDVCTTVASESARPEAVVAATPAPEPATAGQCTIKGNINSDDEKIYHTVGCGSYSKTIIDESAGERWFCTESDALQAGWRKALNC